MFISHTKICQTHITNINITQTVTLTIPEFVTTDNLYERIHIPGAHRFSKPSRCLKGDTKACYILRTNKYQLQLHEIQSPEQSGTLEFLTFITHYKFCKVTKISVLPYALYTYTVCFRRNSKYFRRRQYGLFRVNKFT